jgi:phospholipase C
MRPIANVLPALFCTVALGATAAVAAPRGLPAEREPTATPIKHLVVIFDENVSFDHYFGTYPQAANPPGEPHFASLPGTPAVNNLLGGQLLRHNPNLNPRNGRGATNPFRLDRSQAATADQNHGYTAEQLAYHGGAADLFPLHTGQGTPGGAGAFGTPGQVMGYFDGNTVTALWHYAQHFAMSDAAYTGTYGPSTPGALEVVSGQTNGVRVVRSTNHQYYIADGAGGYTLVSDVDPAYDVCSSPRNQVRMLGPNIGELLSAHGVTWGGFMGGFDLQRTDSNGTRGCARSTYSTVVGQRVRDYIPHHNWFQYFKPTANPTHARPASLAAVGYTYDANGQRDPANHEYGLTDFYAAARTGNLPAVSFLKAPAFQDGHAGYSDPLDEQAWIVKVINFLEQQPEWRDTAVIITWDDSDGWYDHAFVTPTNPSYDKTADQLDGPGMCGRGTPLAGIAGRPVNGRCGPGTRIPFLVISPFARIDYVSHVRITQASVVHFIEDNWLHGQRLGHGSFDASAGSILNLFDFKRPRPAPRLFLDESTGEPVHAGA